MGVRHRLAGEPSEDFYAWASTAGRLAVAVADGVGSVQGSAGAAERACRAAVEATIEEEEGPAPLGGAVAAAGRAAEGGGATTLLVAVVSHDGTVSAGRVGDSTAFIVDPDGSWRELFGAPDPDRVDRSTAALPGGEPEAEFETFTLEAGSVLVLATDGIADPWRDGPETVAPAMVQSLVPVPEPAELLVAVDFSRQGCHDDRTVVAVWMR